MKGKWVIGVMRAQLVAGYGIEGSSWKDVGVGTEKPVRDGTGHVKGGGARYETGARCLLRAWEPAWRGVVRNRLVVALAAPSQLDLLGSRLLRTG